MDCHQEESHETICMKCMNANTVVKTEKEIQNISGHFRIIGHRHKLPRGGSKPLQGPRRHGCSLLSLRTLTRREVTARHHLSPPGQPLPHHRGRPRCREGAGRRQQQRHEAPALEPVRPQVPKPWCHRGLVQPLLPAPRALPTPSELADCVHTAAPITLPRP